MKAVDVTLLVNATAPALPCRTRITYKEEPGQPVSTLVFHNWNLQAAPPGFAVRREHPRGIRGHTSGRAHSEERVEDRRGPGDGRRRAEAGA